MEYFKKWQQTLLSKLAILRDKVDKTCIELKEEYACDDNYDDDDGEAEREEADKNGDMESPVKKGRIGRSAVHCEFEPVELFHKRLGRTVDGRRCLHCDQEFLNKNKSNLEDHIRVFHKDVYKRARGLLLYTLFFLVELDFEISHFSAIDDAAREAKRIYLKEGNAPIPSRDEMGGVRFRISRSAVHDEFVPVELFHKRLGTNVEGRRCLHCDEEFLNKNKTNLDDHLKVFHADVYQRALGM